MCWSLTNGSGPRLSELAAVAAGARGLLLATDPDREGEAIAWHITEELQVGGKGQGQGGGSGDELRWGVLKHPT